MRTVLPLRISGLGETQPERGKAEVETSKCAKPPIASSTAKLLRLRMLPGQDHRKRRPSYDN
jgi:hypothetical protein